MSDIEMVVMRTRRIEQLLRDHYHADGKGLHQLISSCEQRLPHELIPKLRFIATVRNKTVHEHGFRLDDKKGFIDACKRCEKELVPRGSRLVWGAVILLITAITLGAIWFYAVNWHHVVLDP